MLPILVLDLATYTGWAVIRNNGDRHIVSGMHIVAKPGTGVGPFLAAYEDWLGQMLFDEAPAVLVFEAPLLPKKTTPSTVRKLVGLAGTTEKMCHREKITCYEAHGGTVLKYFTGYGGGSTDERKASVLAECHKRGFRPHDHNEADAISIMHYAVHRLEIKGVSS